MERRPSPIPKEWGILEWGLREHIINLLLASYSQTSRFRLLKNQLTRMERRRRLVFSNFFISFLLLLLMPIVRSDLVISKVRRVVDLSSHVVRVVSRLEVDNEGPDDVFEVIIALPHAQAKNLAAGLLQVVYLDHINEFLYLLEPKPKPKIGLPLDSHMSFYSVSLPKKLGIGETLHMHVLATLTHLVEPSPKEIAQGEYQLVIYNDTLYYTSPYPVKYQVLEFGLPGRLDYYTKYPNVTLGESELRYGPFKEQSAFSHSPLTIRYEYNNPFAVASNLIREIEISHWGNVRVAEKYTLSNAGARLKNGFSRLEYQTKSNERSAPSLRTLVARFPPKAHSVYYIDKLGNISTSHLWGDSQKTQLEIELRFPLFGGWQTMFAIGYSLPLEGFLFEFDGDERVFNLTFGCTIGDLLVEKQTVKVVLPGGSKDIKASYPFPTKDSRDVKYSHLAVVGRPVVVMEMDNVTPEHNQYFLVYYKFNSISLWSGVLYLLTMLIVCMFIPFLLLIVYMHVKRERESIERKQEKSRMRRRRKQNEKRLVNGNLPLDME